MISEFLRLSFSLSFYPHCWFVGVGFYDYSAIQDGGWGVQIYLLPFMISISNIEKLRHPMLGDDIEN